MIAAEAFGLFAAETNCTLTRTASTWRNVVIRLREVVPCARLVRVTALLCSLLSTLLRPPVRYVAPALLLVLLDVARSSSPLYALARCRARTCGEPRGMLRARLPHFSLRRRRPRCTPKRRLRRNPLLS